MNKLQLRWQWWTQWCLGLAIASKYPALDHFGWCLLFWACWLTFMGFMNTMTRDCGNVSHSVRR